MLCFFCGVPPPKCSIRPWRSQVTLSYCPLPLFLFFLGSCIVVVQCIFKAVTMVTSELHPLSVTFAVNFSFQTSRKAKLSPAQNASAPPKNGKPKHFLTSKSKQRLHKASPKEQKLTTPTLAPLQTSKEQRPGLLGQSPHKSLARRPAARLAPRPAQRQSGDAGGELRGARGCLKRVKTWWC